MVIIIYFDIFILIFDANFKKPMAGSKFIHVYDISCSFGDLRAFKEEKTHG